MAQDEMTTDVPEHCDLRPKDYWDRRARRLGATDARPAVSCGEENLLCLPGDLWERLGGGIREQALKKRDAQSTSPEQEGRPRPK